MNAIELVLSIPEIKSEHPRLYSQALGELETMKGQAARIAELEAGLEDAIAELEMQLCIRWNCTHDEIRAVNKYVIAARALLAKKG